MSKPIQIWKFSDAPEKYRGYFDSDDADWLAILPASLADEYITWLDEPFFGCCAVQNHQLKDGTLLKVGYHS